MASEFSIGKIFETVPTFYKCKDGALSTHNGRGACMHHGGLSSAKAIKLRRRCKNIAVITQARQIDLFRKEKQTDLFEQKPKNTERVKPTQNTPTPTPSATLTPTSLVLDVPLSQINTAEKLFQNRKHSYSIRSVENIVQAVLDGSFRLANFDPIILWEAPDKKLYVLSGHSRFEAFKRLVTMNKTVDGRTFDRIPAKIERGISLEQAKEIALNSNTLSTKESDIERAEYYRNLRNTGLKKSEIEKLAARNEGRNASTIIAFSFLYQNGKALNALTLLDDSSGVNQQNARIIAKWLGEARQRFSILSDQHENEIYDWLLSSEGYGRSKGQMSKETDFLQRLGNILQKKGAGGMFNDLDPSKPLNIKNLQYKSPVERDYDEQLTNLKTEITDLEKELNEKRRDLSRRGGSIEDIERITAGISATIARKQRQYFDLLAAKGKMIEAAQSQQSLFVNGLRGIQRSNPSQYLRRL